MRQGQEPLKVLYLINDLRSQGGAEIALANLIRHLDPSRIDVHVAGLFGGGPLVERLGLPPARIVDFQCRRRFYTDLQALFRIVNYLHSRRIQVIHTHLFAANSMGRIAALIAQTPVVVSTEHNIYAGKGWLSNKADHWLAGFTTQMTAVSNEVRTFAAHQAHRPVEEYIVLHNGVPIGPVIPCTDEERLTICRELGVDPEAPRVIAVGRLTDQKNYPDLLLVAQQVLKQAPCTHFLIVGSGPLERQLSARVLELGLEASVHLLGYRQDVTNLMKISTLLVMTSQWEGLPVALIEAGACCLPVVATSVGGVPEVIEDNVTGILVAPGDVPGIVDAILRLIADPELRSQMGSAARKQVTAKFSADLIAEQTTSLYTSLLANSVNLA